MSRCGCRGARTGACSDVHRGARRGARAPSCAAQLGARTPRDLGAPQEDSWLRRGRRLPEAVWTNAGQEAKVRNKIAEVHLAAPTRLRAPPRAPIHLQRAGAALRTSQILEEVYSRSCQASCVFLPSFLFFFFFLAEKPPRARPVLPLTRPLQKIPAHKPVHDTRALPAHRLRV